MMMMINIVRIFFDNFEGHVITSPAIPDIIVVDDISEN